MHLKLFSYARQNMEGRERGSGNEARDVRPQSRSDRRVKGDVKRWTSSFHSFHFSFFIHGNPVGKGRFSGGREKNK